MHKEYARSVASQVPIKAALQSSSASASVDRQVTVAEVYFATLIAEHNLPFTTSDHFSKLCKVMFPDSEIAKKFSSGRTKTTALVKHALAPAFNENVIATCQSSPFSVLCDGGNDQMDSLLFWFGTGISHSAKLSLAFWHYPSVTLLLLKHFLSLCQMRLAICGAHRAGAVQRRAQYNYRRLKMASYMARRTLLYRAGEGRLLEVRIVCLSKTHARPEVDQIYVIFMDYCYHCFVLGRRRTWRKCGLANFVYTSSDV